MRRRFVTVHPFDPWGDKIGGIESAVRSMLRYAPEEYENCLIGTSQTPKEHSLGQWHILTFRERTLHFYPTLADVEPNRRRWFPLFLRFPLSLREHDFVFHDDILIYHRIEPLALTSIPAARNILCIHGNPDEIVSSKSEVRWRYLPFVYRYFEALAINRADQIFVVNRKGVESLQARYPARTENIHFLPTWFQDEYFHYPRGEEMDWKRNMKQYGLDSENEYILFAGRLEYQKNPELALDTLYELRRERDIHLLIAGDGNLRHSILEKAQRMNMEYAVHWLGSLSPWKLADLMAGSRALLMTSRYEGMPILAMEAHACGLPVVSTASGEIREIVREGYSGKIVEANPHALAEALKAILTQLQVYRPEHAVESVARFRPHVILPDFYRKITHGL